MRPRGTPASRSARMTAAPSRRPAHVASCPAQAGNVAAELGGAQRVRAEPGAAAGDEPHPGAAVPGDLLKLVAEHDVARLVAR